MKFQEASTGIHWEMGSQWSEYRWIWSN